jgi:hypothetical protein
LVNKKPALQSVLRELGDGYNYPLFMSKLDERKKDMNPAQRAGLKQRLELLQTFTKPATKSLKFTGSRNIILGEEQRFDSGMVTIIDLSDPFVDSALAGAIFEICIRLFQRASVDTGKVLVVDEAHKVALLRFPRHPSFWLTRSCSIFQRQTPLADSRRLCYRWFVNNATCQCA